MANFSETQIKRAWEALYPFPNEDPNIFRFDGCGAKLKFEDYNKTDSDYCWTIDHKYPVSLGGNDNPLNLHALHYKNNEKKADNFPEFEGAVQWNPQTNKNDLAIIKHFHVEADLPKKIID